MMRVEEDIVHRGMGLPAACVSGDLPLVAMLLAEGAESGIDMLAADAVRAEWCYLQNIFRRRKIRSLRTAG